MDVSSKFSEDSLRKIAEEKINYRNSVKIHLTAFVLVNALLLVINLLTIPNELWIFYPFFGWLIGLNVHTVGYILYARGVYPMAKRGLIFNLTAYLSTMLLLFLINILTLSSYLWVFFPAFTWGFALIVHLIIYLLYFRQPIAKFDERRSKKENAIEKELQKMKIRLEKKKK